jgi:hypothetical protein
MIQQKTDRFIYARKSYELNIFLDDLINQFLRANEIFQIQIRK